MPVTIVLDSPSRHTVRRLLRSSTTLLGGCMVLCGLVIASPILPIGLLAAAANGVAIGVDITALAQALRATIEAAGTDSAPAGGLSPDQIRTLALASALWVAASVLLIVLGFRLLRRHRALVLFLRRFRHLDATTAVSYAVATTIGSGWRLVTLDDGGVEPIGARRMIRTILAAIRQAVVLTRVPAVCGRVIVVAAIGMGGVFAADVLRSVYVRDGSIDLAQVGVSARQFRTSGAVLLDAIAAEFGVSAAVVLALGIAMAAAAIAFGAAGALRRLRLPRRAAGRHALSLLRRVGSTLLKMLGILLVIEVSRSLYGLGGALSLDAWLSVGEPYLAVLTELLEGRLPVAMIARSLPGAFALLACMGAVAVLTAAAIVAVLLGSAVLLAPVWLFLSSSTSAMARAERNRLAVTSEWELSRVTDDVAAASRYALAPRLVVLRVQSRIWQRAVRSFMEKASVSLVDVSDPTANVLWELELIAESGAPCVAIAEYGSVTALVDAAAGGPAADRTPVQRLAHLLDGRHVLAYTTDDDGMSRFARALRNELLDASLQTRVGRGEGEREMVG